MMIDWNVVGNMAVSVGGFAFVGKWLIKGVEKMNDNLPVMLESIKTLQENDKKLQANDKELFDSRNEQALQIMAIQTGIDYCEACNTHRHKRTSDRQLSVKSSR